MVLRRANRLRTAQCDSTHAIAGLRHIVGVLRTPIPHPNPLIATAAARAAATRGGHRHSNNAWGATSSNRDAATL